MSAKICYSVINCFHNLNHLRFQEIAGALDSALTTSSLVPVQNSQSDRGSSQDLILKQSTTLLESLRSCWREDVVVLSSADKFLRLTLQIISRSVPTGNYINLV